MAAIFVTGSTAGLGALAAEQLRSAGHRVILHARDRKRAAVLRRQLPNAPFVVGDLSSLAETFDVAAQANDLGPIDAVIHNAGIYGGPINLTAENIPATFAVNVLAPYVLTAKIPNVLRQVYLSSGMHRVRPVATDPLWRNRTWSGTQAYSESKFYVTALAKDAGAATQVALASSANDLSMLSGEYLHHMAVRDAAPGTGNPEVQARLPSLCLELSAVAL